jgi:hypothetical protein
VEGGRGDGLRRMTTTGATVARGLRLAAAALILPLAGCATSLTMERISPTEKYSDFVSDVTSAHRLPSGAVVLCVVGRPARTPSPFGGGYTAFSVTLPPHASPTMPKSIRREIPEYRIATADVGGACAADDRAAPLPVRRIDSGLLGDPDFSFIDYEKLAPLVLGPTAEPAAVWVVDSYYSWNRQGSSLPNVIYVDESARFEGRRAVKIETGQRNVKGEPAYVLLFPFAVAWDVLMIPFYLLMALMGGPHGRG